MTRRFSNFDLEIELREIIRSHEDNAINGTWSAIRRRERAERLREVLEIVKASPDRAGRSQLIPGGVNDEARRT